MASTTISPFSTYNTVLTERCGEVYYSLNLDTFFVNCLRCSQEFNLLSCNLFIKHTKECLANVFHDQRNPLSQGAHNFPNRYSTTDYTPEQIHSLLTIKQETEEVRSYNPANGRSLDCTENQEVPNQESSDESDEAYDPGDNNPFSCRKKNNTVILSLIAEYKKHPCLWNEEYKTKGQYKRYDALEQITSAINAKHNTNFTKQDIRIKIVQLRSTFKRVLRKKKDYEKKHPNKKKKFIPHLWYFNKMMFIENKDFGQPLTNVKPRKRSKSKGEENQTRIVNEPEPIIVNEAISDVELQPENLLEHYSIKSEVLRHPEPQRTVPEPIDCTEGLSQPAQTSATKDEQHLAGIIEDYNSRPSLWEVKPDKTNNGENLNEVFDAINQKFYTHPSYTNLDTETRLSPPVSPKKESDSNEESKGNTQDLETNEFCDTSKDNTDFPAADSLANDSNSSDGDEVYESPNGVENKEMVFKIIELFKEKPVLWDKHHLHHMSRNEQNKCLEAIIAQLKKEHDYHLTLEQLRFQIRFLKHSYFRAVRQRYKNKPFFFKKMSFLEPYVKKNPVFVPNVQTTNEQPKYFTLLSEDRPLMLKFIELYKENPCLWDQNHKDRSNSSAHADAYNAIANMFVQNGKDFTQRRVRAAIRLLHLTLVNVRKTLAAADTGSAKEPPVWFYEHLEFLKKYPHTQKKYCKHCNNYFYSVGEYEKHKAEIAGGTPYKCEACNLGFVSKSKFTYHQITHKEPYKCEQCDFQTFSKTEYDVHFRRHKGILQFRCEHCDKGFVTLGELKRHRQTHTTERAFICEVCGKPLVTNADYQDHIKRHRNQRDYKCEICESAFFTSRVLKNHMASHSSERQHVCETCGKAFKRKKTLLQHMALHREEKKYSCNICGKLYAQPSGLHSHMKTH